MAADAWVVHDKFKENILKGDIDTDTDTFSIRLYTSASNIATTSLEAVGSATNELSGNGYTAGGITRTVTVSESSGTTTFDIADAQWTASGGSITARYAAIIDDTTSEVVAHSLLDDTPADVTATDGNTFSVNINASGAFTIA